MYESLVTFSVYPHYVEALACLEGLLLVKTLQMDHVLFESDSISLVKALNSRHRNTLVWRRLTDDACAV